MADVSARYRVHVRGTVQGVGFRPFVYRLARDEGLVGWVRNDSSGVLIEVEGPEARLARFLERLPREAPAVADIAEVRHEAIPPNGDAGFVIAASERLADALAEIPADLGICEDCRRELLDPADRRYLYPFINCTNCGPRFTIAECLPYDRPFTSMKVFRMCPACQAEYDDPSDRRFHAQPNACWECGPRLTLVDASGKVVVERMRNAERGMRNESQELHEPIGPSSTPHSAGVLPTVSGDPIAAVAAALREGKIAAIKGLGGFHLAVDATNQEAVQTLRERKWRERKPFALMVPDLETARRLCLVSDEEERLLADYRKPIVLARKQHGHGLAEAVAPASQYFGIMLPYTPVHVLLMHALRIGDCRLPIADCQLPVQSEIGDRKSEIALVMTSANRTDEPIAIDNAEALERLGAVADFFLLHNRAIIRRSDDSVTRVFQGRPMLQRRARGYVPTAIPVRLPIADCQLPIAENPERHRESECLPAAASEAQSAIGNRKSQIPVLALGGDLKNTICIIRRGRAYLSQHIGDLDHADALSFFEETIGHFEGILETRPALIAHDLHPGYHSTAYALRLAAEGRKTVGSQQTAVGRNGIGPLDPVPTAGCLHLVGVQHHHAHAAACMAEHGLEGPVIGVSLDGTGYGTDGRIWGGEFLVATLADFERVAHLRYVPMPGGERAIKEPWRMALAYLGERVPELERLGVDFERLVAVEEILKRRVACPETSSMGRLFDGVSALLGVCSAVSYEGQAAIELEALAEPSDPLAYPFWLDTSGVPWTIDPCTIVRAVLEDLRAGSSRERVADRFHNTVVEVIRAVCHRIRGERGLATVVLSGGCFQNLLLLQRTTLRLGDDGFDVRTHRLVPTNDGGLALGQAVIALARAAMTNGE